MARPLRLPLPGANMGKREAGMGALRILAVAFAGLVVLAGQVLAQDEPARTLDTVMAELAKGGSIILMRHANAPQGQIASVGLTQNCVFSDGRGLDAKGFFQARFIGEFLKSEKVPIAAGFTSDMCRCWDTARLVAAGAPVDVAAALKSTNVSEVDIFKTAITAHFAKNASSNLLLVTHSNIVPMLTNWTSPEEIPSGLILIVDPQTWTIRNKLNLDFNVSVNQ
jgi:phosphohistidine phosphatase SixA